MVVRFNIVAVFLAVEITIRWLTYRGLRTIYETEEAARGNDTSPRE